MHQQIPPKNACVLLWMSLVLCVGCCCWCCRCCRCGMLFCGCECRCELFYSEMIFGVATNHDAMLVTRRDERRGQGRHITCTCLENESMNQWDVRVRVRRWEFQTG